MQRMRSEDTQVKQRYRLQVTIEETLNGINFQKNSTASGGEMSISANWQILDVESGRRLDSGKFSSVDSVNFLGPRYASIAAERDTERRTLENLADLITDRVVVFLSSHPQ
jgi:LPS-assembly lipoprotein